MPQENMADLRNTIARLTAELAAARERVGKAERELAQKAELLRLAKLDSNRWYRSAEQEAEMVNAYQARAEAAEATAERMRAALEACADIAREPQGYDGAYDLLLQIVDTVTYALAEPKRHSARRRAPSLSPLQGFARELLFPPPFGW
jgi:hypothetical protein